jgi:hypothetical protein
VLISASVYGISVAPATPSAARAPISIAALVAWAAITDVTPNAAAAAAPEDATMLEQVEVLARLSPDFRRWWAEPGLSAGRYGIGTILDAESERREYDHATLLVDEHRHLRMVVYMARA